MPDSSGSTCDVAPYSADVRAVVITRPGGPEVLEVQDVPEPQAGPADLLLDVVAAGVNRADLLQAAGHYPPPTGAPRWPGLEVSGTVRAVGSDVVGSARVGAAAHAVRRAGAATRLLGRRADRRSADRHLG